MGAPELMIRTMVATISVIAVGAVGVIGYLGVVSPFRTSLPGPPSSLGWGDPGGVVGLFTMLAMLGLLLLIIVWYVSAPIRDDKRQERRVR